MGFNPKDIRRGVQLTPRKVIIYGDVKIGKSTLASASPNCLLVPTEDRVSHISCDKTPVITCYEDMLDIFKYLLEDSTNYKTLIVDSLDWLENFLHKYVCEKKGFTSLTDNKDQNVNYGRGLKYFAVDAWRDFMFNCDVLREQKGMSIVFVCHSMVEKVSPPDSDAYDRYTMKLDKNAVAVLTEWSDCVGFYSREVVIKKEDLGFNKKVGKALNIDPTRTLHLQATSPSWISGNSFGLGDFNLSDPNDAREAMEMLLGLDLVEAEKKDVSKKIKKEFDNE